MRPWPGDSRLPDINSRRPNSISPGPEGNSQGPEGNSQGPEDARVPSLMRNPLEPEP